MGRLRAIIVDDMTLVRQGIHRLLKDRDSIDIVGEATDAREAVGLLRTIEPDVVLLDQDMPGLGAAEAVSLMKHERSGVEILVLSDRPDEEEAFRTLEAGASGYVIKDISADNLVRAIHGICNGRTLMHPVIARQLIERFRAVMKERNGQTNGGRYNGLTSRELEIVVEMAKGATDHEIAGQTRLAESTVKSHIRSILRKVGARNRTQAVAFVMRKGLMR